MKYCAIILVCFVLAVNSATAQKRELRKFYREQRGNAETFKIGLGYVTLRLASWIIPAKLVGEDGAQFKHLLSKVQRFKMYAISSYQGNDSVQTAAIQKLTKKLVEKEHFEPLVDVRDGGSIVHLLSKGKDDELGNVIVLVQDEHDFLIVHLHTHLLISDVNQIIRQFAKN